MALLVEVLRGVAGILGIVVAVALVLTLAGRIRWAILSRRRREALCRVADDLDRPNAHVPPDGRLPDPVERYLTTVLPSEGRESVEAYLTQTGYFNMSDRTTAWKRFSAVQRSSVVVPGFLWEARITVFPGLSARVHDAYLSGTGLLHASVAGVVTVAHMEDEDETARGELLRYLAEAPWYPELLKRPEITWRSVDDRHAEATLVDGGVTATAVFSFGDDGLIDGVYAADRGRTVGSKVVPTPWEGRWWNYRRIDGVLVPTEGEVRWVTPQGPLPYWRGRVTELRYRWSYPGTA